MRLHESDSNKLRVALDLYMCVLWTMRAEKAEPFSRFDALSHCKPMRATASLLEYLKLACIGPGLAGDAASPSEDWLV